MCLPWRESTASNYKERSTCLFFRDGNCEPVHFKLKYQIKVFAFTFYTHCSSLSISPHCLYMYVKTFNIGAHR